MIPWKLKDIVWAHRKPVLLAVAIITGPQRNKHFVIKICELIAV